MYESWSRLGFSHYFNSSVWVNDALPSMLHDYETYQEHGYWKYHFADVDMKDFLDIFG